MSDLDEYLDSLLRDLDLPSEMAAEMRADALEHLREDVRRRSEQGMSAPQAIAAAIASFGSPVEIRRQLRRLSSRRSPRPFARNRSAPPGRRDRAFGVAFGADLQHAIRSLAATPALSMLVLLTVALGIGANTAVFTVLDGVLLTPLPYPDPDRLVVVWPEKVLSESMLVDLRERLTSFVGISGYAHDRLTLLGNDRAEVVAGLRVTANHFAVLGVPPALGRDFRERDQWAPGEDVAILSYELWHRRFAADPDLIGKRIALGGGGRNAGGPGASSRTVIGIMPRDYQAVSGTPDAWVVVAMDPDSPTYLNAYSLRAVARLRPGVDLVDAGAETAQLVGEFAALHPTQFRTERLSPIDVQPLGVAMVKPVRRILLALMGAVGLVLVIACANVAHLLLTRALSRQREAAIRTALGASAYRVVRQQLAEAGLLALAGGALGVGLGAAILAMLVDQIPDQVPRSANIVLDARVLGFTLLVTGGSALLFGVAPVLRAMHVNPRSVLATGGTRGSTGSHHRVNNALVAVEVALAMILVVAGTLLFRSLLSLNDVDAGFAPENLIAIQIEPPAGRLDESRQLRDYYEEVFERLRTIEGVEAVGAINVIPFSGANTGIPYRVEGQPLPLDTPSIVGNIRSVTPGHFAVFGIELLGGRMLEEADGSGSNAVAVINEAMARRHWDWPQQDPVGSRLLDPDGDPIATIVGVVSNIRQQSLAADPSPELYFHAGQFDWALGNVVVRTRGEAAPLVVHVTETLQGIDPEVPVVQSSTMARVMAASLGSALFFTTLFSSFAALGLALTMVGVYGIGSYAISQQSREVGIRLALGARADQIVAFSLRRALAPILAGIIAGGAGALFMTRVLSGLLHGVAPNDPTTFLSVAVALISASAAASLLPVWRAARAARTVVFAKL